MKTVGRRILRALIVLVVALALIAVGVLFWANLVMRGERDAALDAWRNPAITITSTDSTIVMAPSEDPSGTGLVFIPGAKVDPYAYLYPLSGIVEDGVTVVITKPTLNLAFFDTRPLSDFIAGVDGVTDWYVGGHSLGGVRACQLADAPGSDVPGSEVSGLVLFGSYCANDLRETGLRVLSIAGSADGLSTPEKIEGAASLLPADAEFVTIEGLNHAGFGSYGVQPGDGVASITREQARTEITEALAAFLG